MSKTLEQRIAEAREDVDLAYHAGRHSGYLPGALSRAIARAERRLRDLEAVRDGLAVEAASAVSVDEGGRCHRTAWERSWRTTILRGIAYKPVSTVDEVEAESEGV